MATIDFEEGEVEDLSDSGHEDSVHEYKVHASQKVGLHKHSKRKRHSQHRTGKIRDSRRRSEALADSCNVETSHTDFENKNRRPKEQDKLPLLEFLSEDEETFVVDRERFDNRRSSEVNRKKKKRRRDSQPKSVSQSRCRYYMDGRCSKGSSCPFLHDFVPNKKKELCKFYAVGMCSKESSCSYLHEEFPCKFFHLTNDCHHGDECKFSHAPLTDFTRSLLEKVVSKHNIDHPSAKSVHIQHTDPLKPPLSGRPGSDNHGDVDYRFDRIPPQMNLSSEKEIGNPGFHPQRMPAVTPNLFAPIYAPGPRQFHPEHDSMHIRGMRPFNMTPGELRPQIVYPKEERCFLSPTTYGPVPYPPHHTMPNSACVPTVNGFRHPSLLETPPRCPQPRVMLPRMRMMDTGNARFPRFTPRCEVFCAPGVRSPTRPIFNSLHEEAIVNSELDKMAALLASSKPITCEPKDDSSVPPSSPLCLNEHNMHPRLESESPQQFSLKDKTEAPCRDNPVEDKLGLEYAAITQLHVSSSQSPVSWRLIPLDMSVKIPYPLMQLPVDDLPHRFEDPRLRGQLTTLRPQPHSRLPVCSDPEYSKHSNELEPQNNNETNATGNTDENPSTSTQRRPVKLQLHEMANTFANNSSEHLSVANRQGDRSYLDDPRFRRRRIMTQPAATQPVSILSQSSPKSATQSTQECSN